MISIGNFPYVSTPSDSDARSPYRGGAASAIYGLSATLHVMTGMSGLPYVAAPSAVAGKGVEDFEGCAHPFRSAAFHEALEILRAMFAGEMD